MGSAEMRSRWLACLLVTGSILANNSLNSEDVDAKISLVAFRVVAQLLHCTREWYSSHWARRSSAGRTRRLLRSSYSWDAAVNPQETLKIHADMRYVFKRQNSLLTTSIANRISNWTPLRTCAITMATNKQTSVSEIPATCTNQQHAEAAQTDITEIPPTRKTRAELPG